MNTIPSAMAVAAVAALAIAAGCSSTAAMQPVTPAITQQENLATDGVKCPSTKDGKGGSTVYVDVKYDGDVPRADPELCFVHSKTTVVWRNPPDKTTTFTLVFDNPKLTGGGAKLAARKSIEGYKVSAEVKGNKDDEFKYTIVVDGQNVDPAVIIK